MHPSNLGSKSTFETLALGLTLALLWLLMHGYHGLTGDGQIYAFQAFARLHPQLSTDLYLQNTSQDRFTLFSPLYSRAIGWLGLENAARSLTLLFTLWFLAAVWAFAGSVVGRGAAWAAVASVLIIGGNYGGSGVFRIVEPFLTARLPAQAMIVTALFCQVRGMKWIGLSLSLAALVIHPLMALPGLLVLACLWLPLRVAVMAAMGGVLAVVAVSAAAVELPAVSQVLGVMDAPWLDVVRQRSQFLFLQLWSMHDWEINALPFICLGFTVIAVPNERIRNLCAAAALVGAAGFAVAFIGGGVGPIAILVQGQAWRWVWITVLVGAVLAPFTASEVWRDEKCGPLCAMLLVLGWTLPAIDGIACAVLASILWLGRSRIDLRATACLRWLAAALGIAISAWILVKCVGILWSTPPPVRQEPRGMIQIEDMFALRIPSVMLGVLIFWLLRIARTAYVPVLLSALLAACLVAVLPSAFAHRRTLASGREIDEFAPWANVIPPTSTVFIAPAQDAGAFVWFTLSRPNYLSLDQSAGVVFSRATAAEVRRRSDVLLPLTDPDWKILTRLRVQSGNGGKNEAPTRPLTRQNLIEVCRDPLLGFVISPEKVGFDPLSHKSAGAMKDWNLYDCSKVRSAS